METTEASPGYDSSEKKKQKKRDQKERKRLRDRALQEVGVQTPIKENHREAEEMNHEVENRSISHPLAKSSKNSMTDHFKTLESPTP